MEKSGTELIKRYKVSENLPAEVTVTESMILHHWNLERELTRQLLESSPETRWQIFEQCYTRFYSELTWLSLHTGKGDPRPPAERFRDWIAMIGHPPKRIYEIGSGSARMLSYLAEIGFDCTATDITSKRQEKVQEGLSQKLLWGNSDGVHLDLFEPKNTYDVVISDQVIEHLHPDDLMPHFQAVLKILKPGGRYMFNTPHRYTGPHDVSQVFECDEPQGMHLKEYTFSELLRAPMEAGFSDVCYVIPYRLLDLAAKFGIYGQGRVEKLSRFYLKIMMKSEGFLEFIPKARWRRLFGKILKKGKIFKDDIFLSAKK